MKSKIYKAYNLLIFIYTRNHHGNDKMVVGFINANTRVMDQTQPSVFVLFLLRWVQYVRLKTKYAEHYFVVFIWKDYIVYTGVPVDNHFSADKLFNLSSYESEWSCTCIYIC